MFEIILQVVYGYLIISGIIFVAIFIFLPRTPSVIHQLFGSVVVSLLWFWLIVGVLFGERKQRKEQRKMAGEE